jgi:hypothetical protein
VKQCTRCREWQPTANFVFKNRRIEKLSSNCKACARLFCREYYQRSKPTFLRRKRKRMAAARHRNRQFVLDYLSQHPCIDCGEADPIVLEFDHVRDTKRSDLSSLVTAGAAVESLRIEVLKCVVRCANCHRRKTAAQLGWFRSFGRPMGMSVASGRSSA